MSDKKLNIKIELPPVTKKNSQRIVNVKRGGKIVPMIIPSARYKAYEKDAGWFLNRFAEMDISEPVNVKALYYMPTRRRVDLTNLHEALHDVLVKYRILEDDNSKIIVSTDGSRVLYDKDNPRTEITITRAKEEKRDTDK